MKNNLIKKIQSYILENNMLHAHDRVLVAFSGGYDSICLALALHALGYSIALAHVNHGLRETAKKDAAFCASFAKKLGVPFYLKEADVRAYAQAHKMSCETAGRLIRYDFFASLNEYNKLATAHHKNDCAETVILHLIRGSGLKGLTGIAPVRGNLIRPLLCLTRAEIEDFVNENKISPCEDETNFSLDFARNRIRLEILPAFMRENPKSVDTICRTASLLQQDEAFLQAEAEKYVRNGQIQVDTLKSLPFPIASRALRIAFTSVAGTTKDLEYKHITYILSHLKPHGKILDLCFHITATVQYGMLIFQKNVQTENNTFCYPLNVHGVTDVPECGLRIYTQICDTRPNDGIYFDYDQLKDIPIVIRSKKPGDTFSPFGMQGRKTLKKLFVDLKIPQQQRSNIPILATESEILWVIGIRRSNAFTVNTQTKKFLKVQEENIYESGHCGNPFI